MNSVNQNGNQPSTEETNSNKSGDVNTSKTTTSSTTTASSTSATLDNPHNAKICSGMGTGRRWEGNHYITAAIRKLFKCHGEYCASQPWEVIVVTFMFLVFVLTLSGKHASSNNLFFQQCGSNKDVKKASDSVCISAASAVGFEYQKWMHTILLITFGCLSIMHSTYRFKKIHHLGSEFIWQIAFGYMTFTFFLFAVVIWSINLPHMRNLEESWFLIPLLIDMQKVTRMSQFVLSSSHHRRVEENLSNGMFVLAPPFTLDTLCKTLLVGVGFHSGIHELEVYAWYATVSVLVNYLVYVTFFPAGLAIALELMYNEDGGPKWDVRQIINTLPKEEGQSPVVHRVKVLAVTLLIVLHLFAAGQWINGWRRIPNFDGEWILDNSWRIGIAVSVIVCSLKYLYDDTIDEAKELRRHYIDELTRKFAEDSKEGEVRERQRSPMFSQSTDDGTGTVTTTTNTGSGSSVERSEDMIIVSDAGVQTVEQENGANGNHPPTVSQTGWWANSNPDQKMTKKLQSIEKVLSKLKNSGDKVDGHDGIVGYLTVPVGVAGPVSLDGKPVFIPMATTEGCLVASVNRGCSALNKAGLRSYVLKDANVGGGPTTVRFESVGELSEAKEWLDDHFDQIKRQFDSTSSHISLERMKVMAVGREMQIRFEAQTGDSLGADMIARSVDLIISRLGDKFPSMEVVYTGHESVCAEARIAAGNWLDGRGKSVVCEAIVPKDVVEKTLKTTTEALANLNVTKNVIGSAMAGSIGGFNAQASNIVTAVFIATGQEIAQNGTSSNCLTRLEEREDGDLYVSCTMPSIEVSTTGNGGTELTPQKTMLDLLGLRSSNKNNAADLARVVCAAVLAGELSLMSALAAGHLVRSHLKHNRSKLSIAPAPATVNNCNIGK